jgi:hypothetical protein
LSVPTTSGSVSWSSPKGQKIPAGLTLERGEGGDEAKQAPPLQNKAAAGRPTPKSEK